MIPERAVGTVGPREQGGGVMATTEKIMDAVRAYGVLSMRLGVDYLAETLIEQHEHFNRIRSMLAPAPDPGLREAIAARLADYWNDRNNSDEPGYFASAEDCEKAAESVLAVLAERGVR